MHGREGRSRVDSKYLCRVSLVCHLIATGAFWSTDDVRSISSGSEFDGPIHEGCYLGELRQGLRVGRRGLHGVLRQCTSFAGPVPPCAFLVLHARCQLLAGDEA